MRKKNILLTALLLLTSYEMIHLICKCNQRHQVQISDCNLFYQQQKPIVGIGKTRPSNVMNETGDKSKPFDVSTPIFETILIFITQRRSFSPGSKLRSGIRTIVMTVNDRKRCMEQKEKEEMKSGSCCNCQSTCFYGNRKKTHSKQEQGLK